MNSSPNLFKILVVDDTYEIRRAFSLFLSNQGYDVLEAESGNKALELLKTHCVDFVISDIDMPDGSGIEFLKACRSVPIKGRPSVILVSGGREFSRDYLLALGAAEFFEKPLNLNQLLSFLGSLKIYCKRG